MIGFQGLSPWRVWAKPSAFLLSCFLHTTVAIAQADQRPTVTVQRIATSHTLDIINEASNVGTRHFNLCTEMLIDTDWTGDLANNGYWSNAEVSALMDELQSSVDPERRYAAHKRILEIIERDDPALMLVHEATNFTAARRDTTWLPAKSFVMDFRSRNFVRG